MSRRQGTRRAAVGSSCASGMTASPIGSGRPSSAACSRRCRRGRAHGVPRRSSRQVYDTYANIVVPSDLSALFTNEAGRGRETDLDAWFHPPTAVPLGRLSVFIMKLQRSATPGRAMCSPCLDYQEATTVKAILRKSGIDPDTDDGKLMERLSTFINWVRADGRASTS